MIDGISLNKAYINGENGKYDSSISNPSIRYGANAADNFKKYIEKMQVSPVELPDLSNLSQLDKDKFEKKIKELDDAVEKMDKQLVPVEFELKYSNLKDGKIDKLSLLGAAYEELDGQTSVSVQQMNEPLKETFGENVSAQVLDLNKDGEIDLAEYSTSILLEDALSFDSKNSDEDYINGIITNKGQNESIGFYAKQNSDIAFKTYQALYQAYGLDEAQEEFLSEI